LGEVLVGMIWWDASSAFPLVFGHPSITPTEAFNLKYGPQPDPVTDWSEANAAINFECTTESLNANNQLGFETPGVTGLAPSDSASGNAALNQKIGGEWRVMNPEGVADAEIADSMAAPPGLFVTSANVACVQNLTNSYAASHH
jgi:hypothetical protein